MPRSAGGSAVTSRAGSGCAPHPPSLQPADEARSVVDLPQPADKQDQQRSLGARKADAVARRVCPTAC